MPFTADKDAQAIAEVYFGSFRQLTLLPILHAAGEARGFRAVRFTNGADNEERMPDVRYRCERNQIEGRLGASGP